jgi:hypothetical protein
LLIQNVLPVCFGAHLDFTGDMDERDDFELVKHKLERRIADLADYPNTISAMAERYYVYNGTQLVFSGNAVATARS